MQKTCKACGKTMDVINFTKSKNIKDGYENKCKKCRLKAKRKYNIKCEKCGKIFKSTIKDARFCYNGCRSEARKNRIQSACSYCGKEKEVVPCDLKTKEFHYCNQDCRTEHLRALMKGENNPNYRKVDYVCDGCGKQMKVNPYRARNQKYIFCSNKCYKENIGQYFTGENNPQWNHNMSKEERIVGRSYPEYYRWRNAVYERDGYICQHCGDGRGHNLNAHHIYNYTEYPDLRTNIDNGITLCKSCHKEFHNRYGYKNNTKIQLNEFLKHIPYEYQNIQTSFL